MPAAGQSRRPDRASITSGLPRLADIFRERRHVSNLHTTGSGLSFDHLIGAGEQHRWHFEAERFRCRGPRPYHSD